MVRVELPLAPSPPVIFGPRGAGAPPEQPRSEQGQERVAVAARYRKPRVR